MENKTSYREVFKSDHLASVDLREIIESGLPTIFKIKKVESKKKTKVAGKTGNFNIATFEDVGIKDMVLNATNSAVLARRSGSIYVEDWGGIWVELFITQTKLKGEVVDGMRIKSGTPVVYTIESLTKLIDSCDQLTQLTALKPWIKKLGLTEIAGKKATEINKSSKK